MCLADQLVEESRAESLAAGQFDADRRPTKGWLRVTRTEAERAHEEQKR